MTRHAPFGRAEGDRPATASARRPRVPILMYHQVTPRPDPRLAKYSVTPRAFAEQMRWLAVAGYTPIGLDALVAARAQARALPRRPVVITFDDGFRDCLEHAVPVLRARSFTAVFFIVTGLVGGTSRWLAAERGLELPMADWPAVRAIDAAGFQCGAHTVSHPRLDQVDVRRCRAELSDSKLMLEDELGREVGHMAYPFGAFDDRVRAIAADAGYRTACSTRPGLSSLDDDVFALPRVSVVGWESLADFACRLQRAAPLRELVRRALAVTSQHLQRRRARAVGAARGAEREAWP